MSNPLHSSVKKLILTSLTLSEEQKDKLLALLLKISRKELKDLQQKLQASAKQDFERLAKLPPKVLLELKQKICALRKKTIEKSQKLSEQEDAKLAEQISFD